MTHDGHGDEDSALVAAAWAGSPAAFNRLVDRHQQAVRAFLRRLVGEAAEADDIAQEVFLAAWQGLASYRGQSSIRSWLCAIAWRKAKSAQRNWLRRRARDTAFGDVSALERSDGAGADDKLALQAALRTLPWEQRAAVALCLGGEFSHSDAAAILGLPLGTIKSHVARGREKLLAALGGAP
jgi:RNA polymerase sigma-70 factor (ECF subfamily)